MKFKFRLLMLFVALLLLTCTGENRQPWYPALEESTVYSLVKNIAEAKNHLEFAQQYQKTGREIKAEQEYRLAQQSIEQIESYYFPLFNSRGHVSSAFRLSQREEIFKAKEEMTKARAQLTRAAANSSQENADVIQQISAEIMTLEQELKKADKSTGDKFHQIALKINKLLNSPIQPII